MNAQQTAKTSGVAYMHLTAIERGAEPITPSDAVDLGRTLGVPAEWLRRGWAE